MSDTCEVVRVVREDAPGGFVEINKTDLKKGDVLYEDGTPDGDNKGLTVNEIKDVLPGATDEELNEMLSAEREGKDRTTAIEAIEMEIDKR